MAFVRGWLLVVCPPETNHCTRVFIWWKWNWGFTNPEGSLIGKLMLQWQSTAGWVWCPVVDKSEVDITMAVFSGPSSPILFESNAHWGPYVLGGALQPNIDHCSLCPVAHDAGLQVETAWHHPQILGGNCSLGGARVRKESFWVRIWIPLKCRPFRSLDLVGGFHPKNIIKSRGIIPNVAKQLDVTRMFATTSQDPLPLTSASLLHQASQTLQGSQLSCLSTSRGIKHHLNSKSNIGYGEIRLTCMLFHFSLLKLNHHSH